MQETQVQSLVQEDPTGCGATKPMYHHHRASVLETGTATATEPTRALETCGATAKEAQALQLECSPCSAQLEEGPCIGKDLEQP